MTKPFSILSICFVAIVFSVTSHLSMGQAQVTLMVEDGSGFIGSRENPINVILHNPSEKVKGVQVDICEAGDNFYCTECETTERTLGFVCSFNEQTDGCVRVVLLHLEGNLIREGSGSIFTLLCDISPSAPSGECEDLNLENTSVVNEDIVSLEVSLLPGEFCFISEGNIIIDGCDTGVIDREIEEGLTISELINECAYHANEKYRKFASCVAKLTNDLKIEGLITGNEKGAIQSCVAQSKTQ